MTDAAAALVLFPHVFEELASQAGPRPATLRAAFDAIFAGAWTPVQIAGFAVALRLRGEDADTIAAAAEAMRAVMIPVAHGLPIVVDTCGTGGDGKGTINVSTAAAVVVAAVGLPVAKHGNRGVSSRSGSADVLEALGVPIDVPIARHPEILRAAGITFLFAPAHHPALRHSTAPARRELAVRTIFNALGPVSNPARATHQLIGAYEDRLRPILAETLGRLGSTHAWVVRGEDGLDEVSPCGPTRVSELVGGAVHERRISARKTSAFTPPLLSRRTPSPAATPARTPPASSTSSAAPPTRPPAPWRSTRPPPSPSGSGGDTLPRRPPRCRAQEVLSPPPPLRRRPAQPSTPGAQAPPAPR